MICFLPLGFFGTDLGPRANAFYHAPSDFDFRNFIIDISFGCANEAIKIARFNPVRIDQSVMANAYVGELLSDVLAAAAEANNRDAQVC